MSDEIKEVTPDPFTPDAPAPDGAQIGGANPPPPDATSTPGIGETAQEQQPPMDNSAIPQSTLCRERMMEVIQNTQMTNDAAKNILELVNQRPELDAQFCMLFGIQPLGMRGPRG